jgi:hypothetical protein
MARKEFVYHVTTAEFGKTKVKFIDRITVDDVFNHLVKRELFRLAGGADPGIDIPVEFKDFLIRAGQFTR